MVHVCESLGQGGGVSRRCWVVIDDMGEREVLDGLYICEVLAGDGGRDMKVCTVCVAVQTEVG